MKLLGAFVCVGLVAGCSNAHNESVTAANAGHKALGQKQFETAIDEFKKAIDRDKDNHTAWWGLGESYMGKQDFDNAEKAYAQTVQLVDNQPMYRMRHGIALYEKAVKQARDEQAKKTNVKPEEIRDADLDLHAVGFEKAQAELQEAVKLNPDLWRAHYFLGKIYRAVGDKPKEEAEEFSKALAANPREQAPYVALSELYNTWDYTDEAIKVASQGVANVPGSNEVSAIWYELGRAYEDKQNFDKAIESYDKAIETKKDNAQAKFQRGQAYYRKGDVTHAKRDLEEFSKSGGASVAYFKQQASTILMKIAAKSAEGENAAGAKPDDKSKDKKPGFMPPKH